MPAQLCGWPCGPSEWPRLGVSMRLGIRAAPRGPWGRVDVRCRWTHPPPRAGPGSSVHAHGAEGACMPSQRPPHGTLGSGRWARGWCQPFSEPQFPPFPVREGQCSSWPSLPPPASMDGWTDGRAGLASRWCRVALVFPSHAAPWASCPDTWANWPPASSPAGLGVTPGAWSDAVTIPGDPQHSCFQ